LSFLFIHEYFSLSRERYSFNLDIYVKPWAHAGPYFLGLIIGYYLINDMIPKFSMFTNVLGWLCAITTWIVMHYLMWRWTNNHPYGMLISIIYASTSRLAYTSIISWIIIVCLTQQRFSTWIDTFLSWKVFVPLSRSTYMVYLCHMWFIWVYIGFKRSLLYCDLMTGVSRNVSNFIKNDQ
jgi:hypothetical protein